ncbi:MAG: ferritin-like domain-containing protein [Actinomycetota bacterium]|nr:ferritin-like domain-containing protein [Actinomycetota bacterium]
MTDETKSTKSAGGVSRRGFLLGAGAAGGAIVVAACSKSKTSSSTTDTTGGAGSTTPTTAAGASGDAKVAALAASLEVLAVATYKNALAAASANKLGAVPAAVGNFATTAMSNHQAALDKWNTVLTSAGAQAVSQPPASLAATVNQMFAQVTDAAGVAKLALLLEQTASDTYLSAIPTLKSKDAITLAGQLQIVDQEHAAILHYVLGEYPVPDVFQTTDKAFSG